MRTVADHLLDGANIRSHFTHDTAVILLLARNAEFILSTLRRNALHRRIETGHFVSWQFGRRSRPGVLRRSMGPRYSSRHYYHTAAGAPLLFLCWSLPKSAFYDTLLTVGFCATTECV